MKKLSEIQKELSECRGEALLSACDVYREDGRKSVQQYLERCRKRAEKEKQEQERVSLMRRFELELSECTVFCGIDEAGRGPLAGPVVAAAVIMPKEGLIPYINDSKQISEKKREELYEQILENAVSVGVGMASEAVIDKINILQATYAAMRKAVFSLDPQPQLLINDAVHIPEVPMRQIPVVKGDAKCYSVAAASIVAKVTRDRIMREYAALYPEYGFEENKGYGSSAHIDAIRRYGLCPIHRRSFVGHFIGNTE